MSGHLKLTPIENLSAEPAPRMWECENAKYFNDDGYATVYIIPYRLDDREKREAYRRRVKPARRK